MGRLFWLIHMCVYEHTVLLAETLALRQQLNVVLHERSMPRIDHPALEQWRGFFRGLKRATLIAFPCCITH